MWCDTYDLCEPPKLLGVSKHLEGLLLRPSELLGHGVNQFCSLCIPLRVLSRVFNGLLNALAQRERSILLKGYITLVP